VGDPVAGTSHILEALKPLFDQNPELILDGEIYNHELKDNFNELMSLAKKGSPSPERAEQIRTGIQYHVYDMPSLKADFGLRSDLLNDLLTSLNAEGQTCVYDVETFAVDTAEEFDQLHGEWVAKGYEGSMLRRDAVYVNDRTDSLLKRKDFDDAEFDIVRIEQGEGNWAGAAKRVVCWLPGADRSNGPCEKTTFEAGLRGSYGANQALLADADNQKVVTIRYFGFTPSAIPKPRFGVATMFHGAARVD
jgi:DNA ligase-1